MTVDAGDRHMLLSTYEHRDADEMIRALELVLEMYARPGNWQEERHGEPPHYLRKGKLLNFDPSNVVHGYRFAEEALAALARFRVRLEVKDPR